MHRQILQFFPLTILLIAANAVSDVIPGLWEPFGGMAFGCNGDVYSAVETPDGLVMLGGSFTACENLLVDNLVLYDLDSATFLPIEAGGLTGGCCSRVTTLQVYGGDVYAGGSFNQAGSLEARNVARWDGTHWHALGDAGLNGTNGGISELVAANGFLYAAGGFTEAGGIEANNVARWDGVKWQALGEGAENGVNAGVTALAVSEDNVFVGGGSLLQAGTVDAKYVARWDGSQWQSLKVGEFDALNGGPTSLALLNGDLYAGGSFSQAGGVGANNIAHWDGSAWHPLGSGFMNGVQGQVRTLAAVSGDLYLGGTFNQAIDQEGGKTALRLVRWDGNAWQPIVVNGQNGTDHAVYGLAPVSSGLVVAGAFSRVGNQLAHRAAIFDGSEWLVLGKGDGNAVNQRVNAILVHDQDAYAAGVFGAAGSTLATSIARWDGDEWHSLGVGDGNGLLGEVYSLMFFGDSLYAGGAFDQSGRVLGCYLTDKCISANGIARWDGSQWHSMDDGSPFGPAFPLPDWVRSFHTTSMAATENELYVAAFNPVDNETLIAVWTGTDWSLLDSLENSKVQGSVRALIAIDGDLFVAGSFPSAGGLPARSIARWNGSEWHVLGSEAENGVNGSISSMLQSHGQLYIGGDFTETSGVAANRIAGWDGEQWHALSSGLDVPGNPGVGYALTLVASESGIFAGGWFERAGGVPVNGIAHWNGQSWAALQGHAGVDFDPGAAPVIRALGLSGNRLYISGNFFLVQGQPSYRFASFLQVSIFQDRFQGHLP